jgi:hypothetical protein
MAAKGISLHIGLNRVDQTQYEGWSGDLRACESDAACMRAIAQSQNYVASESLLTAKATANAVFGSIKKAAADLKSGDFFLLTYSGHGGRIPDPEIEGKQVDTWALYDRMIISHELYRCWGLFPAGVRIFMLSDSCHSGSMARTAMIKYLMTIASTHQQLARRGVGDPINQAKLHQLERQGATLVGEAGIDEESQSRGMDPDQLLAICAAHHKTYDQIFRNNPPALKGEVAASVLLISGCKDDQTSADGTKNGLFTAAVLAVWKGGHFSGNYPKFHEDILTLMPDTQQPVYFPVGADSNDWNTKMPFVP